MFITQKQACVSGSMAVRRLLMYALDTLLITDSLNERAFPYRLSQSNRLVSFSHSSKHVAVALGKTKLAGLGVDVEDGYVSMAVARRFFAREEVAWLEGLAPHLQIQMTRRLWMMKESRIKAYQEELLSGLRHNLMPAIQRLTVFQDDIWQTNSPRCASQTIPTFYGSKGWCLAIHRHD